MRFWIWPLFVLRLAVVQLADRRERQLVGQAVREDVGQVRERRGVELQRVAAELRGQLVEPGQRAPPERRAAQLRPRGDRVEPRRRVVVGLVRAVGEAFDGLVEVRGAFGVGDEVGGLGLRHPDRRPEDHAGEADAADRGPEQLGLHAVRLEAADLAGAREQVHRHDVLAEAARRVVVLAVDVVGDRPADGHLAGARQHRHPQPEGQRDAHEAVEGDAGVEVDQPGLGVDGVDAVAGGHVEDEAARVLRGVAVGAPEAAGDDPSLPGSGDRLGQRLGGGDLVAGEDGGPTRGGARPPGERLHGARHPARV